MCNDPDEMIRMSLNNFTLANKRFRSDIVARRIEEIHNRVLNE